MQSSGAPPSASTKIHEQISTLIHGVDAPEVPPSGVLACHRSTNTRQPGIVEIDRGL